MSRILEEYKKNGFIIVDINDNSLLENFNKGLRYLLNDACNRNSMKNDDIFHKAFIELDRINHDEIHFIYNVIRNSNITSNIVNDKLIEKSIKTLFNIEESPYYVMYNVCRMDPPSDKKYILPWHQESFSTIPEVQSVQLWAPLIGSNNAENGSIDILVGSHVGGVIPHYLKQSEDGDYTTFFLKNDQININKYKKITVDMSPGQALLFHPNLIHKSNTNNSNRVRYSLTAHILNPLDKSFKLMSYNEIIRLNRKRSINSDEFSDLIEQEDQTYIYS